MQLFSVYTALFFDKIKIFFAPENIRKTPSKVAHNLEKRCFFQYCQLAQISYIFHKNGSLHDFLDDFDFDSSLDDC